MHYEPKKNYRDLFNVDVYSDGSGSKNITPINDSDAQL